MVVRTASISHLVNKIFSVYLCSSFYLLPFPHMVKKSKALIDFKCNYLSTSFIENCSDVKSGDQYTLVHCEKMAIVIKSDYNKELGLIEKTVVVILILIILHILISILS